MGNLEKAGVGVVVVLLLVIMVVAFTTDDVKPDPGTGERNVVSRTEDGAGRSRRVDSEDVGADINRGAPPLSRNGDPSPVKPPDDDDYGVEEFTDPGKLVDRPISNPGENRRVEPDPQLDRPKPEPVVTPVTPAPAPVVGGTEVQVGSGDSLWKIAARAYGAGRADAMVPEIMKANGLPTSTIRENQKLKLPPAPARNVAADDGKRPERPIGAAPVTEPPLSRSVPLLPFVPDSATILSKREMAEGWYVVKSGETLSQIVVREMGSMAYLKALKDLNGISNPDRIYAGMKLRLPAK